MSPVVKAFGAAVCVVLGFLSAYSCIEVYESGVEPLAKTVLVLLAASSTFSSLVNLFRVLLDTEAPR